MQFGDYWLVSSKLHSFHKCGITQVRSEEHLLRMHMK